MTYFYSNVGRALLALLGGSVAACTAGEPRDIGADARDAGSHDAGPDAALDDAGADSGSSDAATGRCAELCTLFECVGRSLCDNAIPLEPGTPRTMQDSASGGHAECALSGSGVGGPSLYYTLTLPAERWSRIVATPPPSSGDALVRVLADCDATQAEHSARGGAVTNGVAEVCVFNDATTERAVVVAVSRYSGETMDVPIAFDLSVEILSLEMGCPP